MNAPKERVTMLLENNPYPQDIRVRQEAESLVAAGHQVEVIAPRAQGQPRAERVNGVEVRRFPVPAPGREDLVGLLREYAAAAVALHLAAIRALIRGSTVIHIHNPPDFLFAAGLLFRLAGREVVFDHHDLAPELAEARFGSGSLVRVTRLLERLTFAVASHVVAANQSHAEIALTRGGKRPDQVTVVRNGPRPEWLAEPVVVRPGDLDEVRLTYLGTIGQQDGVDALAEILARVTQISPTTSVHLTVVGDGDGRWHLEAALDRWGVRDQVTITGWLPLEEVPRHLRDADVCVDPAPATALNEQSTMIKLAEYLALGKPVVAYELIESSRTVGDAGVLVRRSDTNAFAEAIVQLAHDEELRRELSGRARERARLLTWDHSERSLLAAYATIGERRSRR